MQLNEIKQVFRYKATMINFAAAEELMCHFSLTRSAFRKVSAHALSNGQSMILYLILLP